MGYEVVFDPGTNNESVFAAGSNSGYHAFATWVTLLNEEIYPDLTHLAEEGWAPECLAVGDQIDAALTDDPPDDPAVRTTAETLARLCGGGDPGEPMYVTDGAGVPDHPLSPKGMVGTKANPFDLTATIANIKSLYRSGQLSRAAARLAIKAVRRGACRDRRGRFAACGTGAATSQDIRHEHDTRPGGTRAPRELVTVGHAETGTGKPQARIEAQPAQFRPARTVAEAAAWGQAHGVHEAPKSPKPLTVEHWNAVNAEVAKLPPAMLDQIRSVGGRLEILHGQGITDHPDKVNLKGEAPRGWRAGLTWDNVPGSGPTIPGQPTIIVANRLHEGHGSLNLVIHEHAHNFDFSHRAGGGQALSETAGWREIHKSVDWGGVEYHSKYPSEGFARTFEEYFHSPATRAKMDPKLTSYMKKLFP